MATTQLQLVDSKGDFDVEGLCKFVESVGLKEAGKSYAVVAIMGPQSGGKSTLLNHLFQTRFVEMDEMKGRKQTTQGAWLGVADEGLSPLTLVMDLEGADGKERGEDDTLFERQSALFALAVADTVIFNMWCQDIGRVHGSSTPLLKTVMEVMMRMKLTSRQKTFLFVIRDKTNTPEEKLEADLRGEMQKIWESLRKPEEHEQTPLSAFFDVHVAMLPHFVYQFSQWKERVGDLRGLFAESLIRNVLTDGGRVPGNAFSLSTKELWYRIKDNKELDLPSHRAMVASMRCDQILNEILESFQSDDRWLSLEMQVKRDDMRGFGETVNVLVKKYSDMYSSEIAQYDDEVRTSKLDILHSKIQAILQPVQKSVIKYHRKEAFSNFKQSLDSYLGSNSRGEGLMTFLKRCETEMLVQFDDDTKVALSKQRNSNWEQYQSEQKQKLSLDIQKHAQDLREKKLVEEENKSKKDLESALEERTTSLLRDATCKTWSGICILFITETERAICNLMNAVNYLEPTQDQEMKNTQELREYGRGIVKQRAKAEADHALARMLERFKKELNFDASGLPRQYLSSFGTMIYMDNVVAGANDASLKVLSVLAAVRLNDEMGFGEIDDALNALLVVPEGMLARIKRHFYFDYSLSPEAVREKVLLRVPCSP